MDHQNESYYNNLLLKITEFKTENNQRTHSKTLLFIENISNRRSNVSTRGDSLVLAAMKLEYQTHTKVNVGIKNKKDKIIKSHKIFGYDGDVPNKSTETTDITAARRALPATLTCWHQELLLTSGANINNPNACHVCSSTDEKSTSIGHSYKNNKVTQQRDYNYWVHQNCSGLFFKRKEHLDKVSFYCPPHREKTKKKRQDQSKKSSASGLRRYGGKKRRKLPYIIKKMTNIEIWTDLLKTKVKNSAN